MRRRAAPAPTPVLDPAASAIQPPVETVSFGAAVAIGAAVIIVVGVVGGLLA